MQTIIEADNFFLFSLKTSQEEASALMDTIIAKDVLLTKSDSLDSKYGSQLTQRQTTKLDVQ